MLPTLYGRIQSRIVLLATIGGLWTLIITPLLPTGLPLGASYRTAFLILLAVMVLGIGWEFLYHFIQQFRWEKDWPTLFGLVTMVPEGALLLFLIRQGAIPGVANNVPLSAFLIQFITTWLIVWIMANGPVRLIDSRWRFRGGRFW